MIEVYLGDPEDRQYIQVYLENVRKLHPVELFTLPNVVSLNKVDTLDGEPLLDARLFWQLVTGAVDVLHKEYSPEFVLLDPSRYFFGILQTPSAIGGFHSKYSVGYHQLYRAGFVVAMNMSRVRDIRVRTADAVRSYLHDCLHHSTFHAYRRVIRKPTSAREAKSCEPRIYREQYGFNFRNQDGLSYSDKSLTSLVPRAINLNLLMDGIVVIVTASLIRRQISVAGLNDFDNGVFREIIGESCDVSGYTHAKRFFDSVTHPSQTFIDYWGGKEFMRTAFTAMMTGQVTPLVCYFNQKCGDDNAWEKVFKRSDFTL